MHVRQGSRTGRRSALGCAALAVFVLAGLTSAAPATAAATVTEVAAGAGHGHPVAGTLHDLAARGYEEREFLLSGQADTYEKVGYWRSNGAWQARVGQSGQNYTTRLLVERPKNPAQFNGTVVVEWLNVSFGVDLSVEWSQSHEQFTRAGYAYVGVTAQKTGADKLKSLDPARYGAVSLGSDALSYSIFAQAARAVRDQSATLLGTGRPATVLAAGHSQSAGRLVTFANAVQPLVPSFDGFLIHGRGGSSAPIGDGLLGGVRNALIRTDTAVPVFTLESETDMSGFSSARQPDTAKIRTWEVAGTAHADAYGLTQYNAQNARDKAINGGAPVSCDEPVNAMTFRYASNAAFHHLDRWARGQGAPPAATPLTLRFGSIRRDADGNALGGVRLPDLDAPLAAYGPTNSGGDVLGACLLLGTTTPFTAQRIAQLYPDRTAYVNAFVAAADRARTAGHLLPADHAEAVARARASLVP